MATIEVQFPNNEQSAKIKKWRIASGTMISVGRVLLLYHSVNSNDDDNSIKLEKKLRATQFGRVKEILVKEGEIIQPGQAILSMTECKHPTVINDLCAKCGADLRQEAYDKKESAITDASVPMLHSIPELKVCPELAEKIGKEDEQRLLNDKKLVLLVDLDQTIVHTTNEIVPALMKDVFHYQLYGSNSPWYHTRLRPGTRQFLTEMSKIYELHICTFGARNYAHTVAALLDKEGALFSYRILSRDECFNSASKTANLKALFPCGDDLVCIIDDREDVWQGCGNLVQVKPYHYFRHTGDIHSPPGLEIRNLPETKNDDNSVKIDTIELSKNNIENEIDEKLIKIDTIELSNNITEDKNNDKFMKIDRAELSKSIVEAEIDEKFMTTDTIELSKNIVECENNENGGIEIVTDKNDKTDKEVEKIDKKLPIIDSSTVADINQVNNDNICIKIEDNTPVEVNNDKDIKSLISNCVKNNESDIKDDDHDDYLLYLEDILRRIHTEFYNYIDKNDRKPLREIIPQIRCRVLKGLYLTFSGLIPTHQKLNQSHAYKVATVFGAEVTPDLMEKTTHLVATKSGTLKLNNALKNPNIKIVSPDWLWTCSERWEHVDERLFPFTAKIRESRVPYTHCANLNRTEDTKSEKTDSFANSINPLMSFTQEEIDNMDKEVDEDMTDIEMDGSVLDAKDLGSTIDNESDESVDMNDELFQPLKKRSKVDKDSSSDENDGNDNCNNENEDDDPVEIFRRGGSLPDDLDLGENGSQDSVEIADPLDDDDDDREWNAMGAALEREFLAE